jgi:hypothetical protein
MMFLQNCDELFDLPAPALTFSSPWGGAHGREGDLNASYGDLQHGQVVPEAAIRRGLARGIVGLACMVLLSPDATIHAEMLRRLQARPQYGNPRCVSGFDEQLIADTLVNARVPIRHIHPQYNWIVGKHEWLGSRPPKTQQYYNGKPWDGVKCAADRGAVDASPWEDVRDWWHAADEIMQRDPSAASWFYPGRSAPVSATEPSTQRSIDDSTFESILDPTSTPTSTPISSPDDAPPAFKVIKK